MLIARSGPSPIARICWASPSLPPSCEYGVLLISIPYFNRAAEQHRQPLSQTLAMTFDGGLLEYIG